MAAKTVTLVCTLSPRPGKIERVKTLLVSLAQNVHDKEGPGCSKYLVLEQTGRDSARPDMVLIEEWRSQADLDKHHERAYLKDTHDKLEDEDLLMEPEVIKVVERVYGFEGR